MENVCLLIRPGLLRDGLTVLLERRGFSRVYPVSSWGEADHTIQKEKVHILIVELQLSGSPNGGIVLLHPDLLCPFANLHMIRELREESRDIRVFGLVQSIHQMGETRAADWGCDGLLYTDRSFTDAVKTLGRVEPVEKIRQNEAVSEETGSEAAEPAAVFILPRIPDDQILTARETEILKAVCRGATSKETAHQLRIKISTVMAHRKNIKQKIGAASVADMVKYALKHGHISL